MSKIAEILQKNESELLADWMKEQLTAVRRRDLMNDGELQAQSTDLLRSIASAARNGNVTDVSGSDWAGVRERLTDISASRAKQGFSPDETALFVFSLKQPLFTRLRNELAKDPNAMFAEMWNATVMVDRLGLMTFGAFLKAKEQLIAQQAEEMLELSTPVVKLWQGIVAIPLIGTLDSNRTQIVMESLLSTIVATNSKVAIIDITGVPAVDTLVAQHLLKTITAAKLMGAECILSGIRPQIAQTIVHLGINLNEVITKASLADALATALQKTGKTVVRIDKQNGKAGENKDGAEVKQTPERKGA
ncbi:MAG: STAS domain-containing protein [Acidobacteria bacterium]|nr:STAS domain-containing protein [Acidobacteriota bacterium]MBV9438153.1 STAS domain-containing protein [Acidobacteriota bacterium]